MCDPKYCRYELASPCTTTLRVSRPTSARMSTSLCPYAPAGQMELSWSAPSGAASVRRVGDSTAAMVAVSMPSKLPGAVTNTRSPTRQSTGSVSTRVVVPAAADDASVVHVRCRGSPCSSSVPLR